MSATLEHVNISVSDPRAVARALADLFDWQIRWEGAAMGDGYSVHVGTGRDYVALYRPGHEMNEAAPKYRHWGGLNHIGVVVDDLEATEARVTAAGYATHSHADYEPGRRFYFDGPGGVEIEVACYG